MKQGLEVLKKMEFIGCHEQFLTPTARFADILLPVTIHMEQNDITSIQSMGHSAVFSNKVVEPAAESRPAREIFAAFVS